MFNKMAIKPNIAKTLGMPKMSIQSVNSSYKKVADGKPPRRSGSRIFSTNSKHISYADVKMTEEKDEVIMLPQSTMDDTKDKSKSPTYPSDNQMSPSNLPKKKFLKKHS